jgi:hypothetical protein
MVAELLRRPATAPSATKYGSTIIGAAPARAGRPRELSPRSATAHP